MTEADLPAFMDVFRSVMVVFNIRQDAGVMAEEYFKALKPYPVHLVAIGADKCKSSLKRFPKPLDWKENIPRPTAEEVPEMSRTEAHEYLEAESCFFEMPRCECVLCGQAGVTHRPIRYVPDDDELKAKIGDRVILRGHWAHGQELKRWYAAKEAFWANVRRTVGKSGRHASGFERLTLPPTGTETREPGQEG